MRVKMTDLPEAWAPTIGGLPCNKAIQQEDILVCYPVGVDDHQLSSYTLEGKVRWCCLLPMGVGYGANRDAAIQAAAADQRLKLQAEADKVIEDVARGLLS